MGTALETWHQGGREGSRRSRGVSVGLPGLSSRKITKQSSSPLPESAPVPFRTCLTAHQTRHVPHGSPSSHFSAEALRLAHQAPTPLPGQHRPAALRVKCRLLQEACCVTISPHQPLSHLLSHSTLGRWPPRRCSRPAPGQDTGRDRVSPVRGGQSIPTDPEQKPSPTVPASLGSGSPGQALPSAPCPIRGPGSPQGQGGRMLPRDGAPEDLLLPPSPRHSPDPQLALSPQGHTSPAWDPWPGTHSAAGIWANSLDVLFCFVLGLELLAYATATATATQDPSLVCDLYPSSWQHQILNPLREARDRTCVFTDTS